jgi:hypothetical protein
MKFYPLPIKTAHKFDCNKIRQKLTNNHQNCSPSIFLIIQLTYFFRIVRIFISIGESSTNSEWNSSISVGEIQKKREGKSIPSVKHTCSASAGIGQIGIKSLKRYVNES